MTGLTAARMREIAGQADALADLIEAARAEFRAAGEPVTLAGFRLGDAAGSARAIARQMLDTAADLARLASRPDDACGAAWGACPVHGNTLTTSGGRTWCTAPGCGREWAYDRLGLPCAEPAVWLVTGSAGGTMRLCRGHGTDAASRLDGARLARIGAGQ